MRVAMFSVKGFEREAFADRAREGGLALEFHEEQLSAKTAPLADGCGAVCIFVNDKSDEAALTRLHQGGVRLLALRSAGFNHVDLAAAARLGFTVARVPAYSPHAVAEHAVALILALNRKIHRAVARTREHNFALDGLMGFDLHGKTVGVFGTGRIGECFARIMLGFGCRVLAHDPVENPALTGLGVRYASREELFRACDVLSLHCPLTPGTRHMIDGAAITLMKPTVMLVNTGRGALVDTRALIAGLKRGRIGSVALDVYEEEGDVFFRDLSDQVLQDDVLARLLSFPNVIVTAHQAFFTREAMEAIAATTMGSIASFAHAGPAAIDPANLVSEALVRR